MNVANIDRAKAWFEVLQTSERTQTAVMTLAPGKSSREKAQAHDDSDQVLLILQGELTDEVGDDHQSLKRGDVVMIPSRVKDRFSNSTQKRVVTFNIYSPPAYRAG